MITQFTLFYRQSSREFAARYRYVLRNLSSSCKYMHEHNTYEHIRKPINKVIISSMYSLTSGVDPSITLVSSLVEIHKIKLLGSIRDDRYVTDSGSTFSTIEFAYEANAIEGRRRVCVEKKAAHFVIGTHPKRIVRHAHYFYNRTFAFRNPAA